MDFQLSNKYRINQPHTIIRFFPDNLLSLAPSHTFILSSPYQEMVIEMVTISEVTNILSLLSIMVGITMAMMQLRKMARDRRGQWHGDYFRVYTDPKMIGDVAEIINDWSWTDVDDFREKYTSNPDDRLKWLTVTGTFECIATLWRLGYLDTEIAAELAPRHQLSLWRKIKPYHQEANRRNIERARSRGDTTYWPWNPNMYDYFEHLEKLAGKSIPNTV